MRKDVIMKKAKKIAALICILFLLGMYVATFVMALLDNSATMFMFKGCVICTIVIPVIAYGYILLHRYAMTRSGRKDYYSESNDPEPKG